MENTALQTTTAAVTGSLLRTAEQQAGVSAKLLKKAIDADKDLVNTLLPTPSANSGKLDVGA